MAITATNVEYGVIGAGPGGKWVYADITLDSAYATGGETLNAADFGLTNFKAIFISEADDGYIVDANLNAAKTVVTFKVWIGSGATTSASINVEVNTRDLSGVSFGVLIRGT